MRPLNSILNACQLSRGNLWRYALMLALLFWQGGFLFYSTVVIHVAENVLGNHVEPGFITQRVTIWLNFSGCIALSLLLINGVLALWRKAPMRSGLLVTWHIMAVALAALILLHPMLDAGINPDASRPIHNPAQFRHLHQIYLLLTTIQWLAAMIHLWCLTARPLGAPASSRPASEPPP
ncbi:MAG TPA: hypothetical protein VKX17_16590 [Planctomycetota bacterium]|nr:hypothetical protein [Planctomycetota bacterium]